uniref:Uncharacterized protein n=1 Tax=Anguilla anguilla TaxID=7936 RepID=A0A0E9XHW5_ANGAN
MSALAQFCCCVSRGESDLADDWLERTADETPPSATKYAQLCSPKHANAVFHLFELYFFKLITNCVGYFNELPCFSVCVCFIV